MAPEERVTPSGSRAAHADVLPRLVDGTRFAEIAPEGTEVRHDAVLPEERMVHSPGSGCAPADNLARIVDVKRLAIATSQGAQVRHRAVLPEEGVSTDRHGSAGPPDLPSVI